MGLNQLLFKEQEHGCEQVNSLCHFCFVFHCQLYRHISGSTIKNLWRETKVSLELLSDMHWSLMIFLKEIRQELSVIRANSSVTVLEIKTLCFTQGNLCCCVLTSTCFTQTLRLTWTEMLLLLWLCLTRTISCCVLHYWGENSARPNFPDIFQSLCLKNSFFKERKNRAEVFNSICSSSQSSPIIALAHFLFTETLLLWEQSTNSVKLIVCVWPDCGNEDAKSHHC